MPADLFKLRCQNCNQPVRWPPANPRCPRPSCRGPLQPDKIITFDPSLIEPTQPGMWRYRHMLPPLPPHPIALGEGWTPLLVGDKAPFRSFLKNESLNPTGSFKDRGAAMLINSIGAADLVLDDSSGNAGAALAAYAARARIKARIYVPASAPTAKKDQISRYGAQLYPINGNRDAVSAAAEAAAVDSAVVYASHVWHPGYALAMQTIAWEIWEQLGYRAPDWVVMPVGNGSLLRGIRWGFRALQKGKQIRKLPRLVGVQAANCAPLVALGEDAYRPHEFAAQPTVADGAAVPNPPLIDTMARAIAATRGLTLAIPEAEILPAQAALARGGLFVEPTAALPLAALSQLYPYLQPQHSIVLILTGHGFKST